MRKIVIYILSLVAISACVRVPSDSELHSAETPFDIYPDYREVTIPVNIAPLNFMLMDESVDAVCVDFTGGNAHLRVKNRGGKVIVDVDDWHSFVDKCGERFEVDVKASFNGEWKRDKFSIYVSQDSIDPYVTYRLIEPGYEVWGDLKIEERRVEDFEEHLLADNRALDKKCMNCHIHGQQGQTSLFHLRGENGGTMLYHNGQMRKVTLRNGQMAGGAVYGDIEKSGRYGVFSTNVIIPALHSLGSLRLEVYDTKSDLCIADFDNDKMIVSPLVADTTIFETFPAFSADGKRVFYCSAPVLGSLIDSVSALHYSILSVPFVDGEWGMQIDTLWSASHNGGSASFPKASPDGRFVAFCRSNYGTFPIWHRETDLYLIDLATGEAKPICEANSERSDTYHTWSANSRWLAFASKRGDGQYGRVYFSHIDSLGNATKAFVLPQRDPERDLINLKSYNIPDMSPMAARYGHHTIEKIYREKNAVQFK